MIEKFGTNTKGNQIRVRGCFGNLFLFCINVVLPELYIKILPNSVPLFGDSNTL